MSSEQLFAFFARAVVCIAILFVLGLAARRPAMRSEAERARQRAQRRLDKQRERAERDLHEAG